ncbi:MAG: hypothetical protein QRY71_04615 [Candidatus Rhabdochlamydia sp.]
MSLLRRLTLLSSAVMLTASIYGAGSVEPDIQSLQDWINSKRMITVKELGGQLSISGDVHTEMQTGSRRSAVPSPFSDGKFHTFYDVEFNLSVDYRTDNSWLAARLRFDNDAGIFNPFLGSGKKDKFKIDRAYFGYRLIDKDQHTMDVEIGRRGALTSLFDSRIQFASHFDGVSVKDSYSIENVGDVYYQVGAFMVNEMREHAALVGEAGFLNIANTGLYTKYSLIDWDTKSLDWSVNGAISKSPVFDFAVSQMIVGYKCYPLLWKKPTMFYVAGLYNHKARPVSVGTFELTNGKKANVGGYAGFSLGSMKKAGDWAFDANYQVLEAQCIPDFDVSGIGFNYLPHEGFYTNGITPVTSKNGVHGNVNYKGIELCLQYLLTSNLNVFQAWRQSVTLDRTITPFQTYRVYEIDLIYSF